MKHSEKLILLPVCAGLVAMLSACACWKPIDENCTIPTHCVNTRIAPGAVAFNQVKVLPTLDVYRPSFTAGTKRVQAVGDGKTAEAALMNAVAKICIENDCDMLSAAKAIIIRTSHPRWFFFHYDTYQVKLSGLPLTMTSMVKEKLAPLPPAPACKCEPPKAREAHSPKAAPPRPLTKEDVKLIFVEAIKTLPPPQPVCKPALIHLKDIRLSMTASADSDSPVAVKLPPCVGK